MHIKVLRFLPPIIVIAGLFTAGWYVDKQREANRSTLSGFFENQPAEVASKIGGRVLRILVKEGDVVRGGQCIVELDSTAARAKLQGAEAAAKGSSARLSLVLAGPRAEDIAKQEQVVLEARAMLDEALSGPRQQEIAKARALLRGAQSNYDKAIAGPRREDKLQAAALALAANARLDAALRGLTADEIAQYKDRLEASQSRERLATQDYERYKALFAGDAITRQQFDVAKADLADATAKRQEAADAYANALAGTPHEELDEFRNQLQAALQAQRLLLNGTRPEDVAAAKADRDAARQALDLLLAGTRSEDIAAARARLGQAQAVLAAMLAGCRPQERLQAAAERDEAFAGIRDAQINLDEHVITALTSGIVDRVLVADGDVVAAGAPVARIDDPTDIWIRVYVPEKILAHVRITDRALLKVDGIDRLLPAFVESIASQGEFTPANLQTPDERGKQVFEVRLRLFKPDNDVKAGMYATVKSIEGRSL